MATKEVQSDSTGLIAAFDVPSRQALAGDWPDRWSDERGSTWLHFDRKSEEAATWIRERSGLDGLVVQDLLIESTRPRVVTAAGGVLLTLRGVNLNPGADPEDMISIRIWTDARRVVSLQGPRLMAIETLLKQLRSGHGPDSAGDLLIAIISGLTERMGPVIETINEVIDELEDRVIDPNRSVGRLELIDIRQRVITLHRYLSPQAVALKQLNALDADLFTSDQQNELVQQINLVVRYVEDLEAAKGRAVVIQDELANQLAERANQRIYAVTIIAAIFLPLTLVSGLLGMNVGGIPMASFGPGFAIVCVASALLGIAGFWWLRRSDWL